MATDFANGVIRRLDVTNLLSNDGFDEALVAATPRIIETHSPASFEGFLGALAPLGRKGFDMPGFVKRLTDEACHTRYDGTLADGTPAEIRADLFVMPMVGWLADIESFLDEAESLGQIARSFRACGLSGRGSSIVLSPYLVDGQAAADILPGVARTLTELLQRALGNADFPLGDCMQALFGADEPEIRSAGDVIAHRLLFGVRVQVVRRGQPFDDDIFSARPDAPLYHGMEVWRQEMAGIIPQRVQIGDPQMLTRGRSALALEIVTGHLISEAMGSGVVLGEAFDKVNIAEGQGEILVSAFISDRTLGPANVPTMLAFSDAEWFAEKIVGLSRHTVAKKPGTTEKTILQ
jgi:hypothetical protein